MLADVGQFVTLAKEWAILQYHSWNIPSAITMAIASPFAAQPQWRSTLK
jgi:hypothetical protein